MRSWTKNTLFPAYKAFENKNNNCKEINFFPIFYTYTLKFKKKVTTVSSIRRQKFTNTDEGKEDTTIKLSRQKLDGG